VVVICELRVIRGQTLIVREKMGVADRRSRSNAGDMTVSASSAFPRVPVFYENGQILNGTSFQNLL